MHAGEKDVVYSRSHLNIFYEISYLLLTVLRSAASGKIFFNEIHPKLGFILYLDQYRYFDKRYVNYKGMFANGYTFVDKHLPCNGCHYFAY